LKAGGLGYPVPKGTHFVFYFLKKYQKKGPINQDIKKQRQSINADPRRYFAGAA
jgi:hypothetical protein